MTKTKNFYFFLVLLGLSLDFLTKKWASSALTIHFNEGLFLGLGDHFFGNILIVLLGVLSIFVLGSYFFVVLNLEEKYRSVKLCLSFLIAGILGNTLDRILYGKTIDFIPGIKSYYNLADIFIVLSIFIIIFLILKKNSILFLPNSLRKNFSINKTEQKKVGLLFALTAFLTSLLFGVFFYTFLTFQKNIPSEVFNELFIIYISVTILNCQFFYFFGFYNSHKSIGALYAFEQFILRLINNEETRPFKLRENDDYKHLEDIAQKLEKKMKNET